MLNSRTNSLIVFIIFVKFVITYSSSLPASTTLNSSTEKLDETLIEDFLLCRSCGTDSALTNFVFTKFSHKSIAVSNETIFGKQKIVVQLVENPLNDQFEIIVLKKAQCAQIGGNWKTSYSWFEGYAWKLCLCPKCAAHLGWMFEPLDTAKNNQILPSDEGFYALDVSSVIAETDLRSILVTQYKQEL